MTTGLDTLDCWISGKDTEVDSGQDHYTEPLVRLTDPTVTYRRPVLDGPVPSRRALGMPSEGAIYLCPQTTFKLHPDFDPVMGEILRRDPEGHIVLPSPKIPTWKPALLKRMSSVFDVNRLVWLPRCPHQQFLAALAAADVLIDPLIYGGCNTSLEALAMRTPVVTLPSPFLRDRYTAAWYRCVGVTDCIVETTEEYVDLTVRLGNDPELRDSIMQRVAANDSRLFDNPRAVREHEVLFEELLSKKA
jgi:predicted O-linked N-acetylglucosamine transferase (SPINDLY family)